MDKQAEVAQATDEATKKLAKLLKGIRVAMMNTIHNGTIRSRPMAQQEADFDGELWFFTKADSSQADDVQKREQINLTFADPADNRYISVAGSAEVVRDKAKAKALWSPLYKAWFPRGLEDPELALLRVRVDQAEYWDSPSGTMVQIAGFIKALVTGKPYQASQGEHDKVALR